MSNTFNLTRFIRLFKKHTLEHAKTYLLSTGVLAGVTAIGLGLFVVTNGGAISYTVTKHCFYLRIDACRQHIYQPGFC
jgi:hypothetical protein